MFAISKPAAQLVRFKKDKRGNVLMLMGFALIPITMAAGMTVDYTRAARLKTKLDAAADAAVLSAVSEAANTATDKTVCERAAALFDSQARTIPQINYAKASSITLTVGSVATPVNVSFDGSANACSSPAGSPSSAANRVVSFTYAVESQNLFGALFSQLTLPVTGRAGSESSIAPNIDFYVALDTSPSMALPVTAAGIDNMTRVTAMYASPNNDKAYSSTYAETKKGCAFACHSNKIQHYVSAGGSLGETIQDNAKYAIVKTGSRNGTYAGHGNSVANNIRYVDAGNAFIYRSTAAKSFCYEYGKYNHSNTCASGSWKTDKNVYNADGTFADSYWYTRNKGITLRVDELKRATSDLVTTALTEATANDATYRAAIYAFDYEANFRKVYPTSPGVITIAEKSPSSTTLANGITFQTTANSSAVELAKLDDASGGGCPAAGCTSSNRYLLTSYKGLFDGMQASGNLPAMGGNGTRLVSDTPQAILFIITDGMSGEKSSLVDGVWSNPHGPAEDRTRSELSGSLPSPSNSSHLAKCNAIKARNVRIAILYTEYTSASIASDEPDQRAWVNSRIPLVEGKLTDCASPGLMLKVSTGGDISAALTALFRKAVATPRLVR